MVITYLVDLLKDLDLAEADNGVHMGTTNATSNRTSNTHILKIFFNDYYQGYSQTVSLLRSLAIWVSSLNSFVFLSFLSPPNYPS
jgi:hypothetical protein